MIETIIIVILLVVITYGSLMFISLRNDYYDLKRREAIWRNSYYDLINVWPADESLRWSIRKYIQSAIDLYKQQIRPAKNSPGGAGFTKAKHR